jgi:threonine synthase
LYDSEPSIVQTVLSTAHPAKFSEAVTLALSSFLSFDFEKSVLPHEFVGLLDMPKRVIDVERADVGLVKKAIEDALVGGDVNVNGGVGV